MPAENGSEQRNGKKKWTEMVSVRLGIIVLLISITTFFNQIYISKSNTIKAAAHFEEKFEVVCQTVDILNRRVTVLETEFRENNLKVSNDITEIKTTLGLMLKKLQ